MKGFGKLRSVALGLLASTAIVAGAGSVAAQGYSWTGLYLGIHAGGAWGNSDVISTFSCPSPGNCDYNNQVNLNHVSNLGSGSLTPRSFTGGGQAGYNWQMGQAVLGVEVDINAFNMNGSRSAAANFPVGVGVPLATTGVDTDWLVTARGRLGWALTSNILLYGTAGLAFTDLQVSNSVNDRGLPETKGSSGTTTTKTGYAVGGGLEWGLTRNWSVKGEYLFVDFGSAATQASAGPVSGGATAANIYRTTGDLNAHIARLGVNYRF